MRLLSPTSLGGHSSRVLWKASSQHPAFPGILWLCYDDFSTFCLVLFLASGSGMWVFHFSMISKVNRRAASHGPKAHPGKCSLTAWRLVFLGSQWSGHLVSQYGTCVFFCLCSWRELAFVSLVGWCHSLSRCRPGTCWGRAEKVLDRERKHRCSRKLLQVGIRLISKCLLVSANVPGRQHQYCLSIVRAGVWLLICSIFS